METLETFRQIFEGKQTPAEQYLVSIGKEDLIPKIKKINDRLEKQMVEIQKKYPDPLVMGPHFEKFIMSEIPKAEKEIKTLGLSDKEYNTMMSFER